MGMSRYGWLLHSARKRGEFPYFLFVCLLLRLYYYVLVTWPAWVCPKGQAFAEMTITVQQQQKKKRRAASRIAYVFLGECTFRNGHYGPRMRPGHPRVAKLAARTDYWEKLLPSWYGVVRTVASRPGREFSTTARSLVPLVRAVRERERERATGCFLWHSLNFFYFSKGRALGGLRHHVLIYKQRLVTCHLFLFNRSV